MAIIYRIQGCSVCQQHNPNTKHNHHIVFPEEVFSSRYRSCVISYLKCYYSVLSLQNHILHLPFIIMDVFSFSSILTMPPIVYSAVQLYTHNCQRMTHTDIQTKKQQILLIYISNGKELSQSISKFLIILHYTTLCDLSDKHEQNRQAPMWPTM